MGNINSKTKNSKTKNIKQIKNIGHTLTAFEKKDYIKRQQNKQNEHDLLFGHINIDLSN